MMFLVGRGGCRHGEGVSSILTQESVLRWILIFRTDLQDNLSASVTRPSSPSLDPRDRTERAEPRALHSLQ